MFTTSLKQLCFRSRQIKFAFGMGACILIRGQLEGQQPPPGPQPPPPPPAFGVPLAGLTPGQLADWQTGKAQFQQQMVPTTGLGPIFNGVSCVACHSGPVVGGSSPINTTRFGFTAGQEFDPLIDLGGSLLQTKALDEFGLEEIPAEANTVAHRNTQPLFGLGLIEAIPASTILAGVPSKSVNGVLGRAAMVVDPVTGKIAVGRFGWKAQQPTLLSFAADAFVNEIGITNRIYDVENAPNGNEELLEEMEPRHVPTPNDQTNPATGKAGIDRLTDFMRWTAPPPPPASNPTTIAGGKLFTQVGCAACHTPSMSTGVNAQVPAFNNKNIFLYSDLLLHNMGSLADGIGQGDAEPTEMRTAPLWGLSVSAPYLHDGGAPTIDAAIREHSGEGAYSVAQYLKLSSVQRNQLLAFLNAL